MTPADAPVLSDAGVEAGASDASKPVVRATGLLKRFPGTIALSETTLEVARGETLCVIGANGAGKTTLLHLLGGLILPSAGHATVFGLHRWREGFEIRRRSTFLLAEPIFGAAITAHDFLRFLAQIYDVPRDASLERIRRLAEEMDMTPHMDKRLGELSLGMKKKVGLIGAFLPEVELRILDEPFAGGVDPVGQERLHRWIRAARARGETTIFSTQVLEQAESVADRVALLDKGSMAFLGTPAEMLARAGVPPDEPRAIAKAFLKLSGKEM